MLTKFGHVGILQATWYSFLSLKELGFVQFRIFKFEPVDSRMISMDHERCLNLESISMSSLSPFQHRRSRSR